MRSVHHAERMDGRRAAGGDQPCDCLERPIARAAVGIHERPGGRAEPRAAHGIGQQLDDRVLELAGRPHLYCAALREELARDSSAKFDMCGPKTIGRPNTAGSRMLCPPVSARLPPTNATVASR